MKKLLPLLLLLLLLSEVFSRGKVNLYEFKRYIYSSNPIGNDRMSSSMTKTVKKTLYLKREKEEVATKIGFSFKKTTKSYFKDCEISQELLNSVEYISFSKKEFVDEYNMFCGDD